MQGILFVDLYYMIIDKLQFVYVLAYQDLLAALKTEDKLSMYSMHRQRQGGRNELFSGEAQKISPFIYPRS